MIFNKPFSLSIPVLVIAICLCFSIAGAVASAQSVVHLEGTSDQKTFKIRIDWIPADLGKENTFNVTFYDSDTGTLIEDVRYDFIVSSDGEQPIVAHGAVHNATQTATFPSAGNYTIRIANIENLGEGMSIPIRVTPEFPVGSSLSMALLITGTIIVRKTIIYLDNRIK